MTACFKQCKWVQIGAIVLGLILGVVLALNMGQGVLVMQIIYLILGIAMGVVTGRVAALQVAGTLHSKLLAKLYQQGDIDGFLAKYETLPGHCKNGKSEHIMTTNYLAAGYAAKGEFEKATSLLEGLTTQNLKFHVLGLASLTHSNLCQFYLWQEKKEAADKELEILEALLEQVAKRQPSVARNLQNLIRLYSEHLDLLEGEKVDVAYLQEEIELSANVLHRSNCQLLLAKALFAKGDEDEARILLAQLASADTNLFANREAKKLQQAA